MTTNKTSFFREVDHFHFLREQVLPGLHVPRMRFWSAACCSGEEPYSLARILVREHVAAVRAEGRGRILGDRHPRGCSTRPFRRVTHRMPWTRSVAGVPEILPRTAQRPLRQLPGGRAVRTLVHFADLNLMDPWPMNRPSR